MSGLKDWDALIPETAHQMAAEVAVITMQPYVPLVTHRDSRDEQQIIESINQRLRTEGLHHG